MTPKQPRSYRGMAAVTLGILAGYIVLIGLLWLQDDLLMVLAMAVSLLGFGLTLMGSRRRRHACASGAPGDPPTA